MEKLLQLDRALLKHINADWHNPFLDRVLPLCRNANTWLPLYVFLFLLVVVKFRTNRWWWVAFAIATVAMTDFVSSNLVKHNIIRVRPCNEPAIADWIRLFKGIYLPKSSSFTSSHAANHFGMAVFFYLTLTKRFGRWPLLFFGWAFVVCYAQMYVGVHYPSDILGGAIIGAVIGYCTAKIYNGRFGLS
jgi:membrane-associated phospholipid phosphatase